MTMCQSGERDKKVSRARCRSDSEAMDSRVQQRFLYKYKS